MDTAPQAELRRDEQDRWLCNAAANCDQLATLQWTWPPAGEGDPAADRVPVFGCDTHR